ncbi:hypothetical protein BH09BAC5_BH09BAC5_00790 [soil metagenome]
MRNKSFITVSLRVRKNLIAGIALFFSSLLSAQHNNNLPTTYITDSGDTVTTSPFQPLSGPGNTPQSCATAFQLATPYNQNNGQRGIMFDITALSNITISCFDVNMATGVTDVAIYYKVGTHVGFQTNAPAWTLIGTAPNVNGLGTNLATYIPVNVNVAVTSGCTVAFYITRTTVNGGIINYTNGTFVGNVYAANVDMQVKDGTGKDYPFGASFTPRRFNGTIHYDVTSNSSGVINGPLTMCAGSNQTFTFTGGGYTNFVWTVPPGTTIVTGQGTNTITILAGSTPGQICVTPSNACGNGPVVCINVSLAPSPTSTVAITNVSCNGGNTGSATITLSPIGVYTYVWSPNVSTTQTASSLSAGTYTVTATNSGGCSTSQTITITQPTVLSATQSQVNVSCSGANNGSATVTTSGGTPGYTYSWSPSGGNGSTASNLTSQNYTCTITDGAGCIITQTFNITSPSAVTLVTSFVQPTCGNANGSASVVASGGAGGYSYSWSSGGTGSTETGLTGGAYVITVTDASGCTGVATVNVTSSTSPVATISASTNILCFGGNNGSSTVSVVGGQGPFNYSWSPSGGNAATASGLVAGSYIVTVTDFLGCVSTDTVTLTQPSQLTSTISYTNVLCNGGNSGTATVTPAGGNPSYSYSWSPSGGNNAAATGLSSQSYTCTITDANGCIITQSASLTEPSAITIVASQVDETCFGGTTGSATAIPSGGSPGYLYSWSPSGGNAQTASSLSSGNYTCTITDANGCIFIQSFIITQPTGLVASSGPNTNVLCNGQATGIVNVTGTGGVPAYTYNWTPNVSSSNSATNLSAGNYQITITDANGCSSTVTVAITEPPLLTVTATANPNSVCNGTPVQLNAVPTGGNPAYIVNWNPGNLTGTTQNITPTATATYTVVVTDANGCITIDSATSTVFPNPTAALSGDYLSGCAPVCVNFSDLSTISSPGVIAAWDWDFGDGNTSTAQSPANCYPVAGQYNITLTVKSADGCTSTITIPNYIDVFANPVAVFSANPQPTTIFNAQIFFTDASSNANTWAWSFGDVNNSSSTLQNPSFTYDAPVCYQVLLTVTSSDGCVDSVSHPICIDPDVSLYVPNAFTPNGDTHNDIFLPIGVGIDPSKFEMWIFDRWGNLIYQTTDMYLGWDGKVQGGSNISQQDTYVWKVIAYDNSGYYHSYIGRVSLIR